MIWQLMSYPISCQWQARAGSSGFGHISIFCSVWEWAANVTDVLLDNRFDDYPVGELGAQETQGLDNEDTMVLEQTPEILARHYFRTIMLSAEVLEDLTILRVQMASSPPTKKNARNDLSRAPLAVDGLIEYANRVCKHKEALHRCNHHIPKRFLDADLGFEPGHYTDWNFLAQDAIEIPRYGDIIETVVGAFSRADELLRDSDNLGRIGRAFGNARAEQDATLSAGSD